MVFVRLVALDADPPPWLSWSTGLYTDEGFYTLDARHEALFGTWAPGNFHDRLLSPLLSLLQQCVFAAFGIGLVQARLISVAFGLLTVCVFWLGLRRAYGSAVADAGALFLGLAPPFVFYNRLALQETPTVFWLVLAFCLGAYGRDAGRPLLPALAGASAAVGVIFKPLAVLALSALLWVARPHGASGSPRMGGKGAFVGAAVVLALYVALWYAPHHGELARMAAYYRVHQMQPHSWVSLWLNVRRGVVGGERGVLPYVLATLPVPLLLAVWGGRRRGGAPFALWLLPGIAFCLLSSYAPSRYYVLFLPALAGLAALGWMALSPRARIAAVVLFLVTSGYWYMRAWVERTYTLRDAGRQLARALTPGSVVAGDMAPALCLGTRFAAAPVQPGLSNDDHPVERLHATQVTVTRTPVWERWWQARLPGVVQPSHRIAAFSFGGGRHYVVDVYQVAVGERAGMEAGNRERRQ